MFLLANWILITFFRCLTSQLFFRLGKILFARKSLLLDFQISSRFETVVKRLREENSAIWIQLISAQNCRMSLFVVQSLTVFPANSAKLIRHTQAEKLFFHINLHSLKITKPKSCWNEIKERKNKIGLSTKRQPLKYHPNAMNDERKLIAVDWKVPAGAAECFFPRVLQRSPVE